MLYWGKKMSQVVEGEELLEYIVKQWGSIVEKRSTGSYLVYNEDGLRPSYGTDRCCGHKFIIYVEPLHNNMYAWVTIAFADDEE